MARKRKDMYLRIKEHEQEKLRKAHMKINNKLLESGNPTIQDSEILHQALELSLDKLDVDKLGRIYLTN